MTESLACKIKEINKDKKIYKYFSENISELNQIYTDPILMKKYYYKYMLNYNKLPYSCFKLHLKHFIRKYIK